MHPILFQIFMYVDANYRVLEGIVVHADLQIWLRWCREEVMWGSGKWARMWMSS